MALKKCEKCGEMVGEAKAFCPVCDYAFVDEERRREKSKFESLDNTVQLGQTMFGNMLSDMGLNISKKPTAPEKRVEVIAPAAEEAKPAENKAAKPEPANEARVEKSGGPNRNRWYSIAGALIILIWLLILIAAFVVMVYMPGSANF